MRTRLVRWAIFSVVVSAPPLWANVVSAQVTLPPPPPPPPGSGGQTTPSSTSTTTSSGTHKPAPTATHKPEPAHTSAPVQTHESRPQPPPPETSWAPPRTMSIRLNPLPFFMSRLSADFEIMLAPHHALVVSPNVTLHKYAFHRGQLIGNALGYADDNSGGVGGEVGYHYWAKRQVEGIYLGPSLIFGATFPPNPGKTFGYYGGAFDVGYQYLFNNGFTLNAGGGIMIIDTAGAGVKAAPRLLAGIGWSF
ncbi:MAG TPA: hypothetical protein VF407_01675 [Polyangiaceae bacterium]